ncbi:class I SAM-dependent methyltransferase [Ferrimonas gelatinilytica]|uniref:MerR family transcriptional regulator n=1 Tax=Ferrimonas gelatinilytica TaxID=1255257 RepID=A0ABP9S899_9GAMM
MVLNLDSVFLGGHHAVADQGFRPQLERESARKQAAQRLLQAMLGQGSLRDWHKTLDILAPDAHLSRLQQQGFDKKASLHLKWLSKDMNEHDSYMADFMTVFQPLERWGPGSDADSLRALAAVPGRPSAALDIGCGKGLATLLLARESRARITAVDNEGTALEALALRAAQQGLADRVTTVCASMTELPFADASFDLLWSEGAAYIMGIENALEQWRRLLKPGGVLVLSDLVWLTDTPTADTEAFWQREYPDMQSVATRVRQMASADYEVLSHFTLSQRAWENYSRPLKARIEALRDTLPGSAALADITTEVDLYEHHLDQFGYQMFVLRLLP